MASKLAEQGHYIEAARVYGSLLPDDTALESLLKLAVGPEDVGEVLIENRRWQIAADYIKGELEKSGDSGQKARLEKQYARALGELGEYKQALPILEDIQAVESDDLNIKWWYGRSLEAVGQINKAKEIYSSLGGNYVIS